MEKGNAIEEQNKLFFSNKYNKNLINFATQKNCKDA
jgi:hypothetical protein